MGGAIGAVAKIASSFIPGLSAVMDIAKVVMDVGSKLLKDTEKKFEEARSAVKMAEQKANQARSAGADDMAQVGAFAQSLGVNIPGLGK